MDSGALFVSAVEAARGGVVRVEGRRRVAASGVWWPGSSYVVTAHHVLRRDEGIRVGLEGGETHDARLVGRDPSTDLALLEVEGAAAPEGWGWSDGEGLGVGQVALALGRPRGEVEASLGLVSALGGAWRTHAGGRIDRFLRADLVMYPGFSGGPLVDAEGQVVGILSSALARGAAMALPTTTVRRVAEELRDHGQIRRARLGVGVQVARLPAEAATNVGQETGLLVVHVEENGSAATAGIHMGDVLLRLNAHPLPDPDSLLTALGSDLVGQTVPLHILRAGTETTLDVTLGTK